MPSRLRSNVSQLVRGPAESPCRLFEQTLWRGLIVVLWSLSLTPVSSSVVLAQESRSEEIKNLLAHAAFYMSPNGRPAEVACFMREAQRLDPDQPPVVKQWYQQFGMDDQRVVLLRFILFLQRTKELAKPELNEPVDKVMTALTNQGRAGAIEASNRLVEAFKNALGEEDLDYANALEVSGDVQALERQHEQAAEIYARVRKIRHAGRPVLERYFGIERGSGGSAEYSAKEDLRRVMSKLADTYWVLGRAQEAAQLRSDPMTLEGDVVRVKDLAFAVENLRARIPIDAAHPSCVVRLCRICGSLLRR